MLHYFLFIGWYCTWKCSWEWDSFGHWKSWQDFQATILMILQLGKERSCNNCISSCLLSVVVTIVLQTWKNFTISRYIFDGINTLQGLWVFVIFVCKDNVTSLLLVTAGLRESKRSKTQSRAKSRANSMQVTNNLVLEFRYALDYNF